MAADTSARLSEVARDLLAAACEHRAPTNGVGSAQRRRTTIQRLDRATAVLQGVHQAKTVTTPATTTGGTPVATNWGLPVHTIIALLVALLAIGVHWPSLTGEFVYDDIWAIQLNPDVRSDRGQWVDVLQNDFWGRPMSHPQSHKSWRPFTILTFRLNHFLHRFEVPGYRLTNLILHGVVCSLVGVVGSLWLPPTTSWSAAILFTVHPIHTEAVCNVVGRAEILSLLFHLLTVWCVLGHHRSHQCRLYLTSLQSLTGWTTAEKRLPPTLVESHPEGGGGGLNGGAPNLWMKWCGVAFFFCSCLSKEVGATIPAVLIVFLVWQQDVARRTWTPSMMFTSTRAAIRGTAAWWVLLMGYLAGRFVLHGPVKSPQFTWKNSGYLYADFSSRFLTLPYIHSRYLWLLWYPLRLSADYSFNEIPVATSLFDSRHIWSLLAYGGLLGVVTYHLKSIAKGESPIFHSQCLVALLWAVGTFIPAAGVLFRVGTVIGERLLYTPSLGWCYWVSLWLNRLGLRHIMHRRSSSSVITTIPFIILLFIFGGKSYHRSIEWQYRWSLWESTTRISPNNARGWDQLVVQHLNKCENTGAWTSPDCLAVEPLTQRMMVECKMAPVGVYRNHCQHSGWRHFVILYNAVNRTEEAIRYAEKCVHITHQQEQFWVQCRNLLSDLYIKAGVPHCSAGDLQDCVTKETVHALQGGHVPTSDRPHVAHPKVRAAATCLLEAGRQCLRVAVGHPTAGPAFRAAADRGLSLFRRSLYLVGEQPAAWFMRGEVLARLQQWTPALASFEAVQKIAPKYPKLAENLAWCRDEGGVPGVPPTL